MHRKTSPNKKKFSFWLKMAVTAILLAALGWKINYGEIAATVTGLQYWPFVLSVVLVFGAIILSAYKWKVLLCARDRNLSLATLTKIYFTGLFMNNFLPSSIGGDLMRIYQVGKKIDNHTEAAASVILERALATVGLAIPALLAVIPNLELLGEFVRPVLWFFVLCTFLVYFFFNSKVLTPLKRIPWRWWQKLIHQSGKINAVMQSYRSRPREVTKVIFYSVIFQMTIVLINFFLLRAMGIDYVSLWHCTLMIPIISAVSMLPVSINGLGIREGAYVMLFGNLGMSPTQSVTLSLLYFIIVTAVSLLGGISFIMEKGKVEYVVTGENA